MSPTLLDLLADDLAVDAIMDQRRSSMDDNAKQNLRRLFNHFVRSLPNTLATRFQNMDALEIPDKWTDYLRRHHVDPEPIISHEGEDPQGTQDTTTSLISRVTATERLDVGMQSDAALRNFHYLFFYDLLRHIFHKAKHTQRGLGPSILEELKRTLAPLEGQIAAVGCDWKVSKLADWYGIGFGVNILASRFGPGCLFILDHSISEDFLRKLPKAGSVYDALSTELSGRLQLPALLEETGLGALGEALRARLMLPFSGMPAKELAARFRSGATRMRLQGMPEMRSQ